MEYTRLSLTNFKCFEQATLDFEEGISVIHGRNGAGKSTLLEACFFALYGSQTLGSDSTLSDVITNDKDACTVELLFSTHDTQYEITREIRETDSGTTHECRLKTPNGVFDQVTEVENRIREIFRMDADAYVNCAYVRQGDIQKLIDASPQTRQDMIDELLQLGKLEEYRGRADKCRLGIKRARKAREATLENITEKLTELEAADPAAELNRVQTVLDAVTNDLETFQTARDDAEDRLESITEQLDEYAEKEREREEVVSEIDALEDEIESLTEEQQTIQTTITDTEREIAETKDTLTELVEETEAADHTEEALETRLASINQELDEIETKLDEVRENRHEADKRESQLSQEAAQLREQAADKASEIKDLEADIAEKTTTRADKQDRLEDVTEEIEAKRSEFAEAPVDIGTAETYLEEQKTALEDLREEKKDVIGSVKAKKQAVEKGEELLDEGKCPECGQPVDGSPHVEHLDDEQERLQELQHELGELNKEENELKDTVETAETLVSLEAELDTLTETRDRLQTDIDDLSDEIETAEATIEDLENEIATLRNQADNKEQAASEAATEREHLTETITTLETTHDELETEQTTLKQAQEHRQTITELEATINEKETEYDGLADRIADKEATLETKQERKAELDETLDSDRRDDLETEQTQVEQEIAQLTTRIQHLDAYKDALQVQKGGLENDLNRLNELQDERDELEADIDRLTTAYEEAKSIKQMYDGVRSDLRTQNVQQLERMLNEMFELVYEDDAYSRIELSQNYELTVYEKDGAELAPTDLSNGEQALFNLSLRCGIYQLIARGVEGKAPLPPLIFDEPTVNLDSGHVNQLNEMITRMRQLGVEQILVVSHNEKIVDAADERIEVTKDATTNRSSVLKESDQLLSL